MLFVNYFLLSSYSQTIPHRSLDFLFSANIHKIILFYDIKHVYHIWLVPTILGLYRKWG